MTRKARGFSLLELMIVLLLMAVVSAVVYPSMSSGMRGLRLESTARRVATLMKVARNRAVQEQSVYRVGFDREKNVYFLADDYGKSLREFPLGEEITCKQISVDGEALDGQVIFVNFYPTGHSEDFEIVLALKQGKEAKLTVDAVTGVARLLKKKDGEAS
jgi:general secretion pathway protein H